MSSEVYFTNKKAEPFLTLPSLLFNALDKDLFPESSPKTSNGTEAEK
jgi:hypothetical protein